MEVKNFAKNNQVGIVTDEEGNQVGIIPLEKRVSITSSFNGAEGFISDGFHTFKELYDHRHHLYMALAKGLNSWKAKEHDDGTMFDGMFIAGIDLPSGVTITYHLPLNLWDCCPGKEMEVAPKWDGHTSDDVIKRLESFLLN
jgi:hypothetical protein